VSDGISEGFFVRLAQGRAGRLAAPLGIVFGVLFLEIVYFHRPAWVWDETYYYTLSSGITR